ncbi:MAG: gamma-glutamyl-gamma-aminobutyrate hydrolase family protein [Candidatus Aegiribacteria sp.]|nr:gamma-glutamyl-gamma-aminobutyrate hydrolase family protein [Candidatus Aegiribacteria sp.]MBD3294484.1 gamma-glutamyl-gamma-aminobutyrate hydrolase family protein [Candidatus Fermentibacteria bacterium]
MKPVFAGLTLNWYGNDESKRNAYGTWLFGLNQSYADLMSRVDAVPVGIIPGGDDMSRILQQLDFVVLTGGGDPDPELYGQKNQGSVNCKRERPVWEMRLYREAREKGIPILGICLGIQLIAMAEGVPLLQDIQTLVRDPLHHHGIPSKPEEHSVEIAEGTFLHSLFKDRIVVSSFHHQAIAEVPNGYRAAARTSDGVIEAIESLDGKVVAVQWHPERDFTGPVILRAMISRIRGKD